MPRNRKEKKESASQTKINHPRAAGFSRWMRSGERGNNPPVKSCLGLLFTLLVFSIVVGGGALIWYLSDTAEFGRTGNGAAAAPPKARPVQLPGGR